MPRRKSHDRTPEAEEAARRRLEDRAKDVLLESRFDAVDARLLGASISALEDNSLRALVADIETYLSWSERNGRTGIPCSQEDAADYAEYLSKTGSAISTIRRRLSGLTRAHRMIGVEKPETTRSLVAETVKTIARRKKRQKPKQAAPARLGQDFDRDTPLSFTLEVLLAACGEDLVGLRDRTMMSMAYDAGLRRSELAAVNTDDIEVYPEGDGSLAIGDAKGRDADDIEYVWISEITVEYMRIWRAAARVEDGALFRPIFVSRKKVAGKFERVLTVGKDAISANSFNEIIKRRARQAWQMGLVTMTQTEMQTAIARLSSHSFRVGVTQDLISKKNADAAIAIAMRWKTTAMVQRYGRGIKARRGAAKRTLSAHRRK